MDSWVISFGGWPILHYEQPYDDTPVEMPQGLDSINQDPFLKSFGAFLDSCCDEQGKCRCPVEKECQTLWDELSEKSSISPIKAGDWRFAYRTFQQIYGKKALLIPAPHYTLVPSFGL